MDPISLTIAGWIVQPAAQALFNVAQEYLLQRLGLKSSPSTTSGIKPLLDEYLRSLMARLDEDRIAKLYGAFSNLKDAPRSVAKHGLLVEALASFQEVAQIPQQGMTGGRPNAELRCMAFLGMAAAYNLLHDRLELIVEKMVEAVHADANIAKKWLGENLVREILARFPRSVPYQKKRELPGGSVKTFKPVLCWPVKSWLLTNSFMRDTGTLIVRDNVLEFQGARNSMQITHIKQVSIVQGLIKVEYGDNSTPSAAFFADPAALVRSKNRSSKGTQLIVDTLRKTYLN